MPGKRSNIKAVKCYKNCITCRGTGHVSYDCTAIATIQLKAKSMHFNESRFSKPWNIHLFTSPSAIKAGMFLGCHNWPWTALLTLWDAQNVIRPLWLLRVSSSVKCLVQRCIRFLYTRYNKTMDKNYTISFSWPTSSHSICHRKENLLVLCIKVKSYCETKLSGQSRISNFSQTICIYLALARHGMEQGSPGRHVGTAQHILFV